MAGRAVLAAPSTRAPTYCGERRGKPYQLVTMSGSHSFVRRRSDVEVATLTCIVPVTRSSGFAGRTNRGRPEKRAIARLLPHSPNSNRQPL